MVRQWATRIVLVLLGCLFTCALFPIASYLQHPQNRAPGDAMMMSLYVAMGIFLLMAVPRPHMFRSFILYSAWANYAHGAVMLAMAWRVPGDRRDFLMASAAALVIGALLNLVVPPRARADRSLPVAA